MTTIRVAKTENYSIISNHCLADTRISFRATGVLCYLLSKPNNWKVRVTELVASHREGRDAIYAALDELNTCGYITKEVVKGEKGRFAETIYVIHEMPIETGAIEEMDFSENQSLETTSGKTVSGETVYGKPGHLVIPDDKGLSTVRTENNSSPLPPARNGGGEETSTRSSSTEPSRQDPDIEGLRAWYDAYPAGRKAQPAIAKKLWVAATGKLSPEGMLLRLIDQKASHDWTKDGGRYIPGMEKYLETRGWEAPILAAPPEPRKTAADWNKGGTGKLVV